MKLRNILVELNLPVQYILSSNVVYALYGGNKIGYLKSIKSSKYDNSYIIDYVEVSQGYRNLGIYKQLIKKTFELRNADMLISEDRLPFVNSLYKKYTNNNHLDRYDEILIFLKNGELFFKTNA